MSLHFFSHVDGLSGAHILCIGFPNSYNFLNRFYSRCWNPVCEGVDAFCYNWLVSPVSLVPRVIRNLVHCKAVGTLIVLAWVSSPFWPVLFGIGSSYHSLVKGIITYTDVGENVQCSIPGIVIGLFFRLCLRLRQSSFRLIISDGVKSGIGIKWSRSDSSDSDYIELMTPLTTPIFDFHSRKRSYDSDSVATENQPKQHNTTS